LADFGFELVTETNSQHPSWDDIVLKGCPGSGTYESGAAAGALHLELCFTAWLSTDDEKTNIQIPAAENMAPERMLLEKRFIRFQTPSGILKIHGAWLTTSITNRDRGQADLPFIPANKKRQSFANQRS